MFLVNQCAPAHFCISNPYLFGIILQRQPPHRLAISFAQVRRETRRCFAPGGQKEQEKYTEQRLFILLYKSSMKTSYTFATEVNSSLLVFLLSLPLFFTIFRKNSSLPSHYSLSPRVLFLPSRFLLFNVISLVSWSSSPGDKEYF